MVLCTPIRHVGDGFSARAEIGRGLSPSHWENQWKCQEGFRFAHGRDGDGKLWDVAEVDPDAIKSIGNVYLDKVDGSEAWVGLHDMLQDPLKRLAELHGFAGCQFGSFEVDVKERIVNDYSRPPVVLRHAAARTYSKVFGKLRDALEEAVGEHHPLSLLYEFEKLF
jgi:hypothetical protein